TGGLLLEHDLLVRRDAFQSEIAQQRAFWESIGMEAPAAETLKISLFAYETPTLFGLLDALSGGTQLVLCLVPEGRILPQIGQYFGAAVPRIGDEYARGNLRVRVLSFMDQEHYDELLWSCDVNFVRGEDSFVRALWAGKPFVWQIYPQQDKVHIQKLKAFLALYDKHLTQSARHAVQGWWEAWNIEDRTEQAWPAFLAASGELERHTQHWTQQLAENNLALNLLDFYKEIGRMRALENEGQ
ncbi:MAG: elongation factor P maturation arginine rhamnosyltransferase EarP, partial [Gallionella sp.]